jgi:molybdopterin-guanine dinucleotide biosynthesis protein A
MSAPAWAAAVLCGGASRRMGRDKALLVVDGAPMVRRVVDAARAAGAATVITVGGDGPGLEAALAGTSGVGGGVGGVRVVADAHPGEGPLGGLLTALGLLDEPVVLALSCDLLAPDPAAMAATVAALVASGDDADVAAPEWEGRPQWLHAAWRRTHAANEALAERFAAGERSVHRAVAAAGLTVVRASPIAPEALADADAPEDLSRGT